MTSQSVNDLYYGHHHDHDHQSTPPTIPQSPSRPTTTTPRTTTTLRPMSTGQTTTGAGQGQGLGLPAILFVSIGSSIILIILLLCIYMTWRHSKARKLLATVKNEGQVGRAIQRASFFPRFSRYRNQPIVVNYPDPDSHLPNYPIRTPYTFSSSSTLASLPGTTTPYQPLSMEQKPRSSIPDVPSYRATIY